MWEISERRLPKFKTERLIAALLALIAIIAGPPRVNAASSLNFPSTEFTILDAQSNFAVGRGRYSIKTVPGGASPLPSKSASASGLRMTMSILPSLLKSPMSMP